MEEHNKFVEIVDGKLLDTTTNILRITREHRNFSEITDPFQPLGPASDHVLQILRRNGHICDNVIKVVDYNEQFVYVNWIEGIPLINLTPTGSWMHQTTQAINFTKISKAVKWMHANGIAHLDIRPKNILVTEDGEPIIIDILGAQPLNEERRLRDLKDLRTLEEELLYTWYNRVIY